MDILTLALLIAIGSYLINHQQQRKRIALLASHLGHYQIEKLMENLTQGYLRALGEETPERRDQIWSLLSTTESQLSEQFNRFAAEFAQVNEADARVSRLAIAVPFASQLFPGTTFDMRQALAIHARGIENMARNAAHLAPRDKAFTMSAELFLMQHTCHWFCKSKTIATARMLARHKTPYEQLVNSVSAPTRSAYLALLHGDQGGKDIKGA